MAKESSGGPKPKKRPTRQIDAFKKTARDLEVDESEEVFDKALDKIGKAKPPPPTKKEGRR